MVFYYNSKARYHPSQKHEEMITLKDLTEVNIVVFDDGTRVESFGIKLREDVYILHTYKYECSSFTTT